MEYLFLWIRMLVAGIDKSVDRLWGGHPLLGSGELSDANRQIEAQLMKSLEGSLEAMSKTGSSDA